MKERKCHECKQCNHKGKPSVTKYSLYCDKKFLHDTERYSIFDKLQRSFQMISIGIRKHKQSKIDKMLEEK